jgi:hypothetical protein
MAIPGTGAISFSQIQTEFGGANPISLSEYYAGGLYTPTGASGTNGAVPGSGAVSISKYYGTRRVNTAARVIFGYGFTTVRVSMTNLVSNTGVVAGDTTGVGTARVPHASSYGGDKAIFGYGSTTINVINLVSNTGVVAADTAGVGTARARAAAAGYSGDKAIFGYGFTTVNVSITNLVSNTGVVASDTTGVGTARRELSAATFG